MPNEIITANNVNIAPLVEELNAYVKTKQVGDVNFEEVLSKLPKTNSPDWKLISGILCNSIVEWASQNANNGGKDLLVHLQSDIGYLMKRLGLTATDYSQSISLLNNQDEYNFNVIVAPGLIADSTYTAHVTQVNSLVSLAENRQDCIAVIDVSKYGSTVAATVNSSTAFDSSYAATYWPWLQSIDPTSGQTVWSPASAFIPGVYSFTDASSEPWFAPAGLIRGALGNVIRAERKLTSGNRDSLYSNNVNPIATFPGRGVVVFGQKTLQNRASALDRVNVRRLLITLKSFISQVADNLVFEQNTIATRNNFLSQVNPYLESVQQRQGLYAFKVVMNETNNTPDVVDRNEMVGQIFLQPTKTAEFIILDFNVLPTGVEFPS